MSEQTQPTISVCIIAKDEEQRIRDCLESVKDLADEIILAIDDRTTDKTAEIGEECGAVISYFTWEDDFAAARNFSLEQATCDWLLVFDADNQLDPNAIGTIKGFMIQDHYNVGAMQVIHATPGNHALQWSQRLFRRGCVEYKGIKHHEAVFDGESMLLAARLYHSGFDVSPEEQMAKDKRDEALMLKQIEREPDRLFHYTNLAKNYRSQERWQDVIGIGEKALSIVGTYKFAMKLDDLPDDAQVQRDKDEYEHSNQTLGANVIYACIELGDFESGLDTAESLINDYPDNIDVRLYAGHLRMCLKDFEGAIKEYQRYLQDLPRFTEEWEPTSLTIDTAGQAHQAYNNMGVCYKTLGRTDRAVSAFQKASGLRSDNKQYADNYTICLQLENKRVRLSNGKLKILFVQRSACIRNGKMATALTARGHQVGLAYQHETLERYGLSDDVYSDVIRLPRSTAIAKLAESLYVAGNEYDIIHCHNEPDQFTGTALGVFGGRKPVIHDTHDLISLRGQQGQSWHVRYFEHMAMQYADGLVFCSEEQLEQARGIHNPLGNKAVVIRNCVSEDHLPSEFLPKLTDTFDGFNIVYQGGLRVGGYRDYRELFRELAEVQGLQIHIYPAFEVEEYEDLAEEVHHIHYHDPVRPDQLLTELTQYDAGIIPLNVDDTTREMKNASLPNKLFEYLAAGLPIIARDLRQLRKFITQHECGILFNNVGDIVDGISEVKQMEIGDEHTFMMQHEVAKLEQLYWHLLGIPTEKKQAAPVESKKAVVLNA